MTFPDSSSLKSLPHHCPRKHPTSRAHVRCSIPRVEWIVGDGEYAVIAWCGVPTVTLHAEHAAALDAHTFITELGCGGSCVRAHEIRRVS
jgi:hypothetical protein